MHNNNINWNSRTYDVLCNPRAPLYEKKLLEKALSRLGPASKGCFIFATSGSTGNMKWVVLSKEAVLLSAKAVNSHLDSNSSDSWLNPLPSFHVGGMGIFARAHLSGARIFHNKTESKWNAKTFVHQLMACKATLTALVPAQIFDLVSSACTAPPFLRAVIVGGGALAEKLYLEAIAKGWPLLPSYGLTECASQVATAEIGSWKKGSYPSLKPLEHVQLDIDMSGRLKIKSPALLDGYLLIEKEAGILEDPKITGWFTTEDYAHMAKGYLLRVKREGAFFKIGGESVDMSRLESLFEEVKLTSGTSFDAVLLAIPDERLGNAIHLAVCQEASKNDLDHLLHMFHCRVFPYEKVRKVHIVREIPKSPLGKILKGELLSLLAKSNF